MNKPELEEEYGKILEGYKASLRAAKMLKGDNNSCSGQLGLLAEIRAAIEFGGELAQACQEGWDFTDSEGRRVSVKATHTYKDTRNIYVSGKIVREDKYECLCVYFWNDEEDDLELHDLKLLYKGSIKKAIAGLELTKNGRWGRYNLKMKHLKELQESGRNSC